MPRGLVARPWLLAVASLAAMAVLGASLWMLTRPGPRQTSDDLLLLCTNAFLSTARDVAADYQQEYGVRIDLDTDSSGALLSKLRLAGDRVDLYLAAEESFIRAARRQGLVAEILPVARQRVVVGVAPGNPKRIAAFADLLKDEVRVVLPNPELTAVGKGAARAVGTRQWEALLERRRRADTHMSFVGTVSEAAQAVELGAADAAVLWDATAREFGLEPVELPEFREVQETAWLGVASASRRPTAALHFARYLTARDRGEQAVRAHHFQPIADADAWEDQPSLVLMSGAMLRPGIDELLDKFQEREGVEITRDYNGCGVLVGQMRLIKAGKNKGKHFPDAYFSCDVSFMSQVQQWFQASTLVSRNDMLLAVPKGNPNHVASIEDVARPELRVGLAHPKNSALGALTDDLLKKLKLHDKVYDPGRKHAVVHANAADTLVNQMRAGALDLIVVYRSNVLANPENVEKYMDTVEMNLPEAVARQPFAVAKDSQHKYLMRRLLEAILSPASKEHFIKTGFQWIAGDRGP
ncbi:MAG: substrate-binding domain-containing protein [Thermoguttaceae bacterium]|jgi:ABC-type molybdate transport system substrate-binding protein